MKFRNFLLSTKVLKYILNDPKCTVPQIREAFGVEHSNPPLQEEKNLYKAISYLNNSELIRKIDFDSILPGGAHFHLMITLRGKKVIRFFEKTFNVIEKNAPLTSSNPITFLVEVISFNESYDTTIEYVNVDDYDNESYDNPYDVNEEIELEADNIIDFSESNPFGSY